MCIVYISGSRLIFGFRFGLATMTILTCTLYGGVVMEEFENLKNYTESIPYVLSFWPPLSLSLRSIWDADEQVGDVNIDMEEFEALFVEKLGNKEAPKKKVAKKGPLVVSLLDRKRAMNISIATAAIKMSYSNIQSVISSMEENILEETQLTQLVENLPTAQEKKMLQEYIENEGGNTERLGNAEKYMAAIITVPFGDQRLKCMVFKSQFPSMVDAFSSNVELINV